MPLNLSSAPMTIDEGTDQKAEWGAVAAGFGAISDDVRGGFQFNLDETTDAFGRSTAKGRAARFNEPLEYGADYAVMTLDLLSRKRRVDPTIATLSTRYLEALYAPTKSAQSLRTTRADVKRRFVKGSKYEALTGMRAWTLLKSEEELLQLSTFTVQSYICAALNCRRLLRMVFGVSSNETVDGIEMTMVDRDKLRQGIDFAMSREFIPPLDPDIYSVDFVPVMDPSNHRVVVENLFVVEITLKRLSSQVYQLSSGRVFFQDVDDSSKVKEADSLTQVRDFIADRCRARQARKLARLQVQVDLAKRSAFTLLLSDLCSLLVAQVCANAFLF